MTDHKDRQAICVKQPDKLTRPKFIISAVIPLKIYDFHEDTPNLWVYLGDGLGYWPFLLEEFNDLFRVL